jgi:hypothetical protein
VEVERGRARRLSESFPWRRLSMRTPTSAYK